MSDKNFGGPAFPQHQFTPTMHGAGYWSNAGGMTMRDWFAGQWLAAGHHGNLSANDAASQAYEFADAMIEARSK